MTASDFLSRHSGLDIAFQNEVILILFQTADFVDYSD